MKKVAIIPLKSDSKRFISKNFKNINGKPLLINTLDKLNESDINIIIISTSLPSKVHNILKSENTEHYNFDALYVINRPDHLIGDTKTELVISDAIEHNSIDDKNYIIVLTQVTSPLWNPTKLKMAFYKLNNVDSVISVSPNYMPNGCFYVFKKSTFTRNNKIFTDNSYLITMPWEESVDIDFEHELSIADALTRGSYV